MTWWRLPALLAAYAYLAYHLFFHLIGPTFTPRPAGQADDFASYYAASRRVAATESPYRSDAEHRQSRVTPEEAAAWQLDRENVTAYVYPSLLAVTMEPLARLPYPIARMVWSGFSLLCFAACAALTFVGLRRRPGVDVPTVMILGAIVASMPTRETLTLGQVNYQVLLLVLLAYLWDQRGRSIPAGVALGVAAALKLTPAVLVLHWLFRWNPRALLAFGVTLLVVFGTLQLVAPGVDAEFVGDIVPQLLDKAPTGNNKAVATWWKYMFTQNDRVEPLLHAPWLARALSALVSIALVAALAWQMRRRGRQRDPQRGRRSEIEFHVWIIAALLVQPYLEVHHLILAWIPLAAFIHAADRAGWGWRGIPWAAVSFALINSRGYDSFDGIAHHWASGFLSNPQVLGLALLLLGLFLVDRVAKETST